MTRRLTANHRYRLSMFQTLLLVESVVGQPYYCIGRSKGIDHSMRRVIVPMTLSLLLRDAQAHQPPLDYAKSGTRRPIYLSSRTVSCIHTLHRLQIGDVVLLLGMILFCCGG
jgi:hypothetical protein